jgi:hypothetical protein
MWNFCEKLIAVDGDAWYFFEIFGVTVIWREILGGDIRNPETNPVSNQSK